MLATDNYATCKVNEGNYGNIGPICIYKRQRREGLVEYRRLGNRFVMIKAELGDVKHLLEGWKELQGRLSQQVQHILMLALILYFIHCYICEDGDKVPTMDAINSSV